MNKSIKRIFIVLFICAFVINITITSYANSHIKIYNTGATEVIGAVLSGGGPFFALVGAALLAAGLVCEAASDDPTDGAVEYFVKDCIVNDHFAGTALEYIYENLEIDENGNINYKQVIDNINAYVEASNIVISSGSAVSFKNGVLRVSRDVFKSISQDIYDVVKAKEPSSFSMLYVNGGVTFGVVRGMRLNIKYNGFNEFMEYLNSNDIPYAVFLSSNGTVYQNFRVLCPVYDVDVINSYGFSSVASSLPVTLQSSKPWFFIYGDSVQPYHNIYEMHGIDYTVEGSVMVSDNVLKTIDYTSSYTEGKTILYYWNNADFSSLFLRNIALPDTSDNPYIPFPFASVKDVYDYSPDVSNIYGVDIPSDNVRENPVIDLPVTEDNYIVIDDGMVNDLDNAFENVIGVIDGIGDNAVDKDKVITDAITGEISDVIDNAADRVEINNPSVVNPDLGNLKSPGLSNKFPFCIPFDLIDLVSALDADPEAPKFTIPIIKNEKYGWDYSIDVDWSDFDVVAKVCRSVEVFCFIGFLILKTRSLIRG